MDMAEIIKLNLVQRVWYYGKYIPPKVKRGCHITQGLRCGKGCPLVLCIAEFGSFYKVSVWSWLDGLHSNLLKTKNYYKRDLAVMREMGNKQTSMISQDFFFEFVKRASNTEVAILERELFTCT